MDMAIFLGEGVVRGGWPSGEVYFARHIGTKGDIES